MSDDRDRRRPGPGDPEDPPPMLVLGENRPDVQDTTPEELLRQKQELERARRELAEQAERRRKEAEEQLQKERLEAERELARRQREIDDAERRLVRTERRLRKEARQQRIVVTVPSGRRDQTPAGKMSPSHRAARRNRLLAAAERRSGIPVPRMPRAVVLALAASTLTVVGAVTSIDPPEPRAVQEFITLDEGRDGWLRVGVALDEQVRSYLAGDPPTDVLGSLQLPEEVTDGSGLAPDPWDLEVFTEGVAPLLQSEGTNPVRVLTAWDDARRQAGYAVSGYSVDEARDALDNDRVWPTLLLLGAVLSAVLLAYGLWRGGTRVGAGLAALGLVPLGLVLADQGRHLDVEPGIESHAAQLDSARDVYDGVGRDLEAVLGARALDTWEREDYWVDDPYWLDGDVVDPAALEGYRHARAAFAGVDLDSTSTADAAVLAQDLVTAGSALVTSGLEGTAVAREQILEHTEADLDLPPYVAMTAAAAALPLAALVPAVLRRREVDG